MPRKSRRTKLVTLPPEYCRGFLSQMDNRTELARALRERYVTIADDLGGLEQMSTVKRSILERYVWLEAILRRIEDEIGAVDDRLADEKERREAVNQVSQMTARWIQLNNSLLGMAKTLGLEKVEAVAWVFSPSDGAGGCGDR